MSFRFIIRMKDSDIEFEVNNSFLIFDGFKTTHSVRIRIPERDVVTRPLSSKVNLPKSNPPKLPSNLCSRSNSKSLISRLSSPKSMSHRLSPVVQPSHRLSTYPLKFMD